MRWYTVSAVNVFERVWNVVSVYVNQRIRVCHDEVGEQPVTRIGVFDKTSV